MAGALAWLELSVDCERNDADLLSELMEQAGALSVSFSDASGETIIERDPGAAPLWAGTRVCGLFASDIDHAELTRRLSQAGFGAPRLRRVEDQEWARAWEQHVRPRRYGARLWVLPSFADESAHQGVCVRLDPGLAFGTGSHATTALCLEWLDGENLDGLEVMDYGCGSGILAIAAAKLGARAVHCVDTDPEALATARENARRNGVADRLRFHPAEAGLRVRVDRLVANIFATPLKTLAPALAGMMKPEARIALSGILSEQAGDVAAAYERWIALAPPANRDGWVRLSGSRRAGHG